MNQNCDVHYVEHRICDHHVYSLESHSHCVFDIWAPDIHSSINNMAFSAYANRQELIEDFIDILSTMDDPNDYINQCIAARCVGLDPASLTENEIEYIEEEVVK